MLRLVYYFGRIRARADIKIDPKFKEYEQEHTIKQQTSKLRQQYNFQHAQSQFVPFSEILKDQKPKLQQQKIFKIDPLVIRKALKKKYHQAVDEIQKNHTQNLTKHRDFLQDRSHIYDQTEEIQFEKKFREELFKKKETTLRVKKTLQKPQNYLSQSINHEVIQYLQAKKDIKNIKTQHMLNTKSSNKFLQKMIQSGILDDPERLKRQIETYEKANDHKQYGSDEQLPKQITDYSNQLQISNNRGQHIVQSSGFLQQIHHQTQEQKSKIIKTLDLMQKVKQFQQNQFLKRYDAINFRFKGVVDFSFYKQGELLSYIKHQKVEPSDLLLIFSQNLGLLNKEKNLIMTPAVITQIYTKASAFRFPQTKQNNRMNMIADSKFAKLQYTIFNNLDKIDDRALADAIYSFSRNHEQQQGSIRPKQFDKILDVIAKQFDDRIGYIDEILMGALCRSLIKLPIFNRFKDVSSILDKIKGRIKGVQDIYSLESICMFCSLIDSPKAKEILSQAVNNFYFNSEWNYMTLVNTTKFFASLLLSPDKQKYKKQLLALYTEMDQQLPQIIPEININNLQSVAAFFSAIGFYNKNVWNSIKKSMADSLKQQKSLLNPSTIPTLISTIAFFDYQYKYKKNNIQDHSLINQFLIRIPLRHNSAKYQIYHEIAKYLSDQYDSTTQKGVFMILKSLAFTGYPNKAFFDTFIHKIMKKNLSHANNVESFALLVNCHGLLRRVNSMTDFMIQKIMSQDLVTQNPRIQIWISYLCSLGNLYNSDKNIQQHVYNVYLKIQPYLWDINNSKRIAILSTLIQVGLQSSIMVNQVLSSFEKVQMQKNEEYLMSLCLQFIETNNSKWDSLKKKFKSLQKQYYATVKDDILQNQFAIGSVFSFQKLQNDFVKSQTQYKQIVSLPWRVQMVNKQNKPSVFFFLTYSMLGVRESDQGQQVQLFPTGIWKMYISMYRKLGYEVQILKSFEFKRTF